ncbi:putative late blight resistance protein homolog R1A-3 [Actinidia eriantha]|uniref:putative late blight resistance protein homolog R1A-3 n=1 Tax=Actinidia eriantha TaxID=165200 RepID=UPI00258F8E89|nr:putative late blight resistance protein homolog R1A-3 [Actinidia eriantha]
MGQSLQEFANSRGWIWKQEAFQPSDFSASGTSDESVCVYRVRDLLQALVKRAMGLTMEDMSDEELCFDLHKYLRSVRYLIVLDDVWRTEFWEELNEVFTNNLYGSRIIITTRHNDVALCGISHLRFLNEEASWELFSKKVLIDEKCPDNLQPQETNGRQMLAEYLLREKFPARFFI